MTLGTDTLTAGKLLYTEHIPHVHPVGKIFVHPSRIIVCTPLKIILPAPMHVHVDGLVKICSKLVILGAQSSDHYSVITTLIITILQIGLLVHVVL